MTTSNLGKWESWYDGATQERPYGDAQSYQRAEAWLAGRPIEDWGAGFCWFRTQHDGPYRGIDGTYTPMCDEVVDLTAYHSTGWDILLKHVLEHNHDWAPIVDNAADSFDTRLLIVLFTPPQETTRVLEENVAGLGVPDIGFRLKDIIDHLDGLEWSVEWWGAPGSGYDNMETALKVWRP